MMTSKFWSATGHSFAMIIATELGDKTFFIAAVLSMRNNRLPVFGGAVAALIVMTILSAAIGFALPNLLPRSYTHYAAIVLFLYFGGKLLWDGSQMEDGVSEELEEVEEELGVAVKDEDDQADLEAGKPRNQPASAATSLIAAGGMAILVQSFTLTFVAEWGDRSQIATIAMAAAKDPVGVALGGFVGHALCTGLAVVGGRLLATRISERTVHLGGGTLFLLFALQTAIFGT
jgi:putative Ca2+/H+ antiporter (TMEM165/GDT1 family)